MSPYTWTLDRAMDRERQRGGGEARREWDAGERTPMADRDPERWALLRGCEKAGYWTAWNLLRRESERPVCAEHGLRGICFACSRIDREARADAFEAEEAEA